MKFSCFKMIPGVTYYDFYCGCISRNFFDGGAGRKCNKHKEYKVFRRIFICKKCGKFCERKPIGKNLSLCLKDSKKASQKKWHENHADIKVEKTELIIRVKNSQRGAKSEARATIDKIEHIPLNGLIKMHREMYK